MLFILQSGFRVNFVAALGAGNADLTLTHRHAANRFAGLTGNQLANFIVDRFGNPVEVHGVMVNPTGYQNVLYVTIVLYIIAMALSMFFVKPVKKDM